MNIRDFSDFLSMDERINCSKNLAKLSNIFALVSDILRFVLDDGARFLIKPKTKSFTLSGYLKLEGELSNVLRMDSVNPNFWTYKTKYILLFSIFYSHFHI